MRLRRIACQLVLAGGLLQGGQVITFHGGGKLRVDRAEVDGDQVITTQGSMVTMYAAAEIARIEAEGQAPAVKAAAPVVKRAGTKEETRQMIREAAKAHGLPTYIMESIAETESGLKRDAVSHKGAIGVMQLMPGTARSLGVDPHDVKQNIEGGTKLMRSLLLKYRNDPHQVAKALAAYNAGSGAVTRYRGIPPYRETRQYVRKIVNKILAAEDRVTKRE
jgi:soluble lytic murein transglycosylase-like protein